MLIVCLWFVPGLLPAFRTCTHRPVALRFLPRIWVWQTLAGVEVVAFTCFIYSCSFVWFPAAAGSIRAPETMFIFHMGHSRDIIINYFQHIERMGHDVWTVDLFGKVQNIVRKFSITICSCDFMNNCEPGCLPWLILAQKVRTFVFGRSFCCCNNACLIDAMNLILLESLCISPYMVPDLKINLRVEQQSCQLARSSLSTSNSFCYSLAATTSSF